MKREKTKLITSIGGQALMEGIMMRGPFKTTVAVRKADGTIEMEEIQPLNLTKKYKILRLPILPIRQAKPRPRNNTPNGLNAQPTILFI